MGLQRSVVLGLLLAAALLAVACSSAEQDAQTPAGTQAASPSATVTATAPPAEPTPATAATTPTETPTSTSTATPTPEPPAALTVATLNVLHGLFCPPETDWCDAPTRLEILWSHVEDAGCPDVVALQEIGPRQVELIPGQLPGVCGGAYATVLFDDMQLPDQEMVLTSLDATSDGFADLAGFPWTAHWALLEAPMGSVALVATHFASTANNPDCTAEICPPELCEPGLETGSCNALQVLDLLDSVGSDTVLQLVVGDLNEPISHPRIEILTDAGFVDFWLEAGNPECDPATGAGCTCCIDGPEPLGGLDIASQQMGRRIDFVLARAGADCEVDGAAWKATPFAAAPVGEPVADLFWASDHGGVWAEVSC